MTTDGKEPALFLAVILRNSVQNLNLTVFLNIFSFYRKMQKATRFHNFWIRTFANFLCLQNTNKNDSCNVLELERSLDLRTNSLQGRMMRFVPKISKSCLKNFTLFWGFFLFETMINSSDQLTNFAIFFTMKSNEIHDFFPVMDWQTFQICLLTDQQIEISPLLATDQRKSRFFFLKLIGEFSDFFSFTATDWQISQFFSAAEWQI